MDLPNLWLCRGCALGHNWWTASALDVVHPEGKGKKVRYHPQSSVVIHSSVVSVGLYCSNYWKPRPRKCIFGKPVHHQATCGTVCRLISPHLICWLYTEVFSSCLAIVSPVMVSRLFLWPALRYGTGYQTVWEIRPSAETPSSVHWRRFYFQQLTRVHSALELSGRCALQIYLFTYVFSGSTPKLTSFPNHLVPNCFQFPDLHTVQLWVSILALGATLIDGLGSKKRLWVVCSRFNGMSCLNLGTKLGQCHSVERSWALTLRADVDECTRSASLVHSVVT